MRVAIILVLSIFAAVALATSEAEYQVQFTSWMHKHSKSYTSADFQTRYEAFKANYDFVAAWDAKAKGFEVETNVFADMGIEEFSKIYLGTKITAPEAPIEDSTVDVTAATVDWRTKGYVTPIKDQGQCGSCYSFSATGSAEGANFKSTGKLLSFSEQELVDCSSSYGNNGCNGGLMTNCFNYIKANGIVAEAAYPYKAVAGSCQKSGKTSIGKVSSFVNIKAQSEADLTNAISTIGPISVAIDASHSSFQLYKTGVYYEAACSATQLDHGVLAVGYGTDGAKPYYLVKNSWGTVWGQAGYIEMTRSGKNNCGIATMASYPIA